MEPPRPTGLKSSEKFLLGLRLNPQFLQYNQMAFLVISTWNLMDLTHWTILYLYEKFIGFFDYIIHKHYQ